MRHVNYCVVQCAAVAHVHVRASLPLDRRPPETKQKESQDTGRDL